MSEKVLPQTATDWLLATINVVLMMGLVGSLVCFLAEVLYAGQYENRLLYTLIFFTIGAVGAARVAVEVSRNRSWIYTAVLALVTMIALGKWVEYPADSTIANFQVPINLLLIAVVCWCTHKLVWDCTFIDDKRPSSSAGLLASMGWEQRGDQIRKKWEPTAKEEKQFAEGVMGWYERYDAWKKQRDKLPHTPGRTVIWFSLAAIPIFGLGQAMIPAGEDARRMLCFWFAATYIFSALSLLLTTSFLGIRRYLRQRMMPMPLSMTSSWLVTGLVMVGAFILVAAVLPRPYSETSVVSIGRGGSKDQDANKFAPMKSGAGKKGKNAGNVEQKSKEGAARNNPDAKDGGGKGKDQQGGKEKGKQNGKDSDSSQKQENQPKQKDGNSDDEEQKDANEDQQQDRDDAQSGSEQSSTSKLGQALEKIGNVLKWIIYVIFALVVLFVLFRNGLSWLSNFMPWAKGLLAALDRWWQNLFRWNTSEKVKSSAQREEYELDAPAQEPFASFSNPFDTGMIDQQPIEETVEYTYRALEAWANDHHLERKEHETPIEFSNRLANEVEQLDSARAFGVLVATVRFSHREVGAKAIPTLQELWHELEQNPQLVETLEAD
ncbi:MAG: DUF4129 domain-containing protein [Zavarzinella sp.]